MSDVNHRVRRQIMGYIVSQSISAVCELGVPDRLADGACLLGDLAASVGADATHSVDSCGSSSRKACLRKSVEGDLR